MSLTKNSLPRLLGAHERSEEGPVWERILQRCRHEREITKIYGPEMRPRPDQPFTGRLVVVVVFTNRSGSNFLCDCLRATGKFELAGEALNWEIVANRTARHTILSFPDYCLQRIGNIGDPAKQVVVKAGIRQLLMLWKYGIVGPEGLFRNTKYVLIERRDVLAQAVSFSIADQTRQFTSRHSKKRTEPRFNPEDIQKRLTAILQQNALSKEFFNSVDVPVFRIHYEALVSDRPRIFTRLADFLEMESLEVDEREIALEKQRTKINDQFERYYKQLMTESFQNWTRQQ